MIKISFQINYISQKSKLKKNVNSVRKRNYERQQYWRGTKKALKQKYLRENCISFIHYYYHYQYYLYYYYYYSNRLIISL